VQVHRCGDWQAVRTIARLRLHCLPDSLVVAAASFSNERPAIGLLAAAVQQRIVAAAELITAVTTATRTRHRAALLRALADIGGGADALSEIDFGRLCHRFQLPQPTRQAVRVDEAGRRRYLDAEWRLPDGRVVAAEVDGAVHLSPQRWYADQLRQNEVVLDGTVVLRFPSWLIRTEPALVARQLRRALGNLDADAKP
jgi:hypothetical protein